MDLYPQGALYAIRKIGRQLGAKGVNPDKAPGGLELSQAFASQHEL